MISSTVKKIHTKSEDDNIIKESARNDHIYANMSGLLIKFIISTSKNKLFKPKDISKKKLK